MCIKKMNLCTFYWDCILSFFFLIETEQSIEVDFTKEIHFFSKFLIKPNLLKRHLFYLMKPMFWKSKFMQWMRNQDCNHQFIFNCFSLLNYDLCTNFPTYNLLVQLMDYLTLSLIKINELLFISFQSIQIIQ